MARLMCCDTCKLAVPEDDTTLLDWLTVSVERPAEEEVTTWNFCSWPCLATFAHQEGGAVVEDSTLPVSAIIG
jgi:hypothetical protein